MKAKIRIVKRGGKEFKYYYIDIVAANGKRLYKTIGSIFKYTQNQADNIAKMYFQNELNQMLKRNEKQKIALSLEEAIEMFEKHIKTNQKSFKQSYIRDKTNIGKIINKSYVSNNVNKMTKHDVQKMLDLFKVSESTRNKRLFYFKQLFAFLIDNDLAESNPADYIKTKKVDNERIACYSDEQIKALIKHSSPHLKLIIQVAAQTGMRKGELLNMKWGWINFDSEEITIPKEYAKSGRTDTAHMLGNCCLTLKELYLQAQDKKGRVFLYKSKPIGDIKTSFIAAKRRAGITGDYTFHTLRHTYITNLAKAGVDPYTLMEYARHKDIKTTMRYIHYAKTFETKQRLKQAFNIK